MISFDDDAIEMFEAMARKLANAVTASASPGRDAAGGHVGSLTEAVMGNTAGLVRIADAINNLADAVRERGTT